MSARLKGFLALIASSILFASFGVWVRLLSHDLLPYQQIGFRNGIALVLALVAVALSRQSFHSLKKVSSWSLLGYVVMFPMAVVLYTMAVLETKILTTLFGLYLGSLVCSFVIGWWWFKEKFTVYKGVSLVLVLAGLSAYAYPFSSQFFSVGFGMAVLSGCFDAIANSLRKFLAGKVDRFVLVVLQMIGGIAVSMALVWWFGQMQLPEITGMSWVIGGIFGLSLVAISYLTLVGFSNFDLNLGTVVLSSELFFASILAFFIFGETASLQEIIGGILIFIATGLAQFSPPSSKAVLTKPST